MDSLAREADDQAKADALFKQKTVELKADEYVLCSFSTGQTFEEHMPIGSYSFRPNELFEVSKRR